MTGGVSCRVCGSTDLKEVRASTINQPLSSDNFSITDDDYGRCAAVWRCRGCGLLQCPDIGEVLAYYQTLKDPAYEDGREQRLLQAQRILKLAARYVAPKGARLLDVGAGSGILLQAAQDMGFAEATGVEPSHWLAARGKEHGLNVIEGVLPNAQVQGPYDLITCVDVIEHVEDPMGMLRDMKALLSPQGVLLVVTPDSASLTARIMGRRWWHYRIAHITYFSAATLRTACRKAGLRIMAERRPLWYFTYAYLRQRLGQYLPLWLLPPAKGPLKNLVIPLNLFDSVSFVCKK